MNEIDKDILKKCENIDKVKKDLNNIDKFESIYSDFKIKKTFRNFPKIIRDSEPSSIVLNEENDNDEQNFFDDINLTYFITGNPLFDSSKNSEKENSKNDKSKIAKSYIDINKDILSRKALENKIIINLENKKIENIIKEKQRRKKKILDIIENIKRNKFEKRKKSVIISKSKIYNTKYNNNKKYYQNEKKKNMKDIYNHLFGINEELSLCSEKRNQVKNTFQRLYNQGFYSKNKSQINILDNIQKIKKESKRENISKKSKEILGLNKTKNNKYDKNNIFKPIKTNMESTYREFQFRPTLNETSKKLVKNMEKSFTRITRSKSSKTIENKKRKISKEKYEKILKRINSLYSDGVEKIKNKNKSKSYLPSQDDSSNELNNKNNSMEILNNCLKICNPIKNSRNIYFNQIQWRKKILMNNEKKKKLNENEKCLECTFKPKINTKSIKYLFQKTAEEKLKTKSLRNNSKSTQEPLKNFNISSNRYFIIKNNKEKTNKINLKEKIKQKNINYSLIQRKSYHLEKFFS